MTVQSRTPVTGPTLADIYPPYRDKLAEYVEAHAHDSANADDLFRQAQAIAQAFWAGVEYGKGRGT